MINPLTLIPPQYKLLALGIALAVAFAAGAGTAGKIAWTWQANKYERQINKMQADAQKARADAEAAARQKEKDHANHADAVAARLLEAQAETKRLSDRNRRLAAELGGLRDPGNPTGNCLPGNTEAAPGTTGTAASGAGTLSRQLESYIFDTAEQADKVTDYAWACYEWANGLKP